MSMNTGAAILKIEKIIRDKTSQLQLCKDRVRRRMLEKDISRLEDTIYELKGETRPDKAKLYKAEETSWVYSTTSIYLDNYFTTKSIWSDSPWDNSLSRKVEPEEEEEII